MRKLIGAVLLATIAGTGVALAQAGEPQPRVTTNPDSTKQTSPQAPATVQQPSKNGSDLGK